jgi:hypothetical protein
MRALALETLLYRPVQTFSAASLARINPTAAFSADRKGGTVFNQLRTYRLKRKLHCLELFRSLMGLAG